MPYKDKAKNDAAKRAYETKKKAADPVGRNGTAEEFERVAAYIRGEI